MFSCPEKLQIQQSQQANQPALKSPTPVLLATSKLSSLCISPTAVYTKKNAFNKLMGLILFIDFHCI